MCFSPYTKGAFCVVAPAFLFTIKQESNRGQLRTVQNCKNSSPPGSPAGHKMDLLHSCFFIRCGAVWVLKRKALQKVATQKKSKKEREPRRLKPFRTSHYNGALSRTSTLTGEAKLSLTNPVANRVPKKANKKQRSVYNDKETSKHLQSN